MNLLSTRYKTIRVGVQTLLLVLVVGCSQEDDPGCFVSDVAFTNLEAEYDCEDTKNTLEIDLQDTFTVIDTQERFDALVTGPCLPTIDFETYSLIVGKQALANGNTTISYDYSNDCATNTYTLSVTFNQNDTLKASNLTYHILSPKIETTATVVVTINSN